MQLVKSVNGVILWANLHLLFWLSLIPFCYRVDGRKSFCQMAGDMLWDCTCDEWYCPIPFLEKAADTAPG